MTHPHFFTPPSLWFFNVFTTEIKSDIHSHFQWVQNFLFEGAFDVLPHTVEEEKEEAKIGIEAAQGGILVDGTDGPTDIYSQLVEETDGLFFVGNLSNT